MKTCSYCKLEKEIEDFGRYKSKDKSRFYYRNGCKVCLEIKHKEWRTNYNNADRQKERLRANQLKRDYGITINDYNDMNAKQNGLCAICEQTCDRILSVDHCHTTGKIRGLLCNNCNTGLGKFKDNAILLHQAINYLKLYQA